MSDIPSHLEKYFWDVNFENLDSEQYARFIIERILEHGDQKAVEWMQDNYERQRIEKVLKKTRALSQKSANFWALVYNLDKEQVLCLKPSFRKKHRVIWEHRGG